MADTKARQDPECSRRGTARRLAWPAVAVVVAAVTLPFGAVHAQAAPSSSAFILGEAQGVAQAVRLSPAIGSFQVAIAIGTSIAGYSDTEGKASAQNLDLGAVGTSLTGPQCDGSNPTFQQSQLPQPLVAESPDGKPQSKHQDVNGNSSTPPADAGVLDVSTTGAPAPSGTASTQGGEFGLKGLIDISGASTRTVGGVVGGNARDVTAQATVNSISLGGGLVVLGNVQEIAHQRTGAGATASGSFTLGSITINPAAPAAVPGLPKPPVQPVSLPVTPDKIASSVAQANSALAPTGVHITLPEAQKLPDGTASVSPLSIGITNSPLGHQIVQPILGAGGIKDQLENALISANCQAATPLTVADLFLFNPATGAGSINFLIGGVSAVSDGTQYADPFGNFGFLSASAEGLGTSSTLGTDGTSGTDGTLGTSTDGTGSATNASPQVANTGATTLLGKLCSTTHLFKHPSCVGNDALPVGIGALAVILGLGYADAMRGRGWLPTRHGKKALEDIKL